jgi:hypothetical protein
MEGIKSFFDSFKEFVWDIIGYLLPGSFLLILLSATISEKYFFYSKLSDKDHNLFVFIFLVLSYLLGYVIYGIGLYKEQFAGKKSFKKIIENSILGKNLFLECKQLYLKKENSKGNNVSDNIDVRELRTKVMSYIPESDQKIYTFTFRSELANHIGNICLFYGCSALIFCGIQYIFNFLFFNSEPKFIILYLLLIIFYFFLKKTRDRFYDISMRVPLSIFMAKENDKK